MTWRRDNTVAMPEGGCVLLDPLEEEEEVVVVADTRLNVSIAPSGGALQRVC